MPGHTRQRNAAPQQDTQAPQMDTGGPQADVPRGGGEYVIQEGDTLWGIAQRTYGSGRYWREILRSNPDRVFRGGDLIIVGDRLTLPTISTPGEGGEGTSTPAEDGGDTSTSTPETSDEVDGGDEVAVEPFGVCTDFGDFMVYPDDYGGPLNFCDLEGNEHVTESEQRRLVQERREAAEAEREAAVSEVNELLSYDWNDWAITDAEATQALNTLASLHITQIGPAVARINGTRLLDNLPDSARSTPAFCKVIVAMGPQRALPYIQQLLSTGLFDWAVTAADLRALADVVAAMETAQAAQLINSLTEAQQTTIIDGLPQGSALSDNQKALLRVLWDQTPDGSLDRLYTLFTKRFNQELRAAGDDEWDAAGLRRAWDVLEALPSGHVEGNPELIAFIRLETNTGRGAGGWYDGRERTGGAENPDYRAVGMRYDSEKTDDFDGLDTENTSADEGDPLYGVNRFDKVVRHEVGHAVDARIGASDGYCLTPQGGSWLDHGTDYATITQTMVDASAGPIKDHEPEDQRTAIIGAIEAAVTAGNGGAAETNIEALDFWGDLEEDKQDELLGDDVIAALAQATGDPWYNADNGGTPLGGRIYQKSYSYWTSYDVNSRARKVSTYQHRAPGEWFAEAYATYYLPDADGNADGSALAAVDPTTKAWFDANVAPLSDA